MDKKPLAGKRVVVTRAPEQAQEMIRALESLGAEVLLLPMVEFAPPDDWRELDDALRKLSSFDAILFLSRNAVRYIFERCRDLGIGYEAFPSGKCMIAAVGQGTAEAITSEGLRVDYIAKNQNGDALVKELGNRLAMKRVLLPRSNRGDEHLSNALRAAGASSREVIAYRTTTPETIEPGLLARVRSGEVHAIIFASPSAFQTFSDCIGEKAAANLSTRVQFVALGPTTANAIRSGGACVGIEAAEPSAIGLVNAIANHYQREAARVRPA
jgi:uroporphyrinogen III methyltransferase/synthase